MLTPLKDPVFRATCQIEYNSALIAKAEGDIKTYETELALLKDIMTGEGDSTLGLGHLRGWFKGPAIRDRARSLLEKMGKSLDKLEVLEEENGEMLKVLSSGKA